MMLLRQPAFAAALHGDRVMSTKAGAEKTAVNRRSLLRMIGTLAGSTAMYNAMTELGLAKPSTFTGPPKLGAAKPGASVLVLGAGIAGLVAAIELRDAGYQVQLLEYSNRSGGRNWTL